MTLHRKKILLWSIFVVGILAGAGYAYYNYTTNNNPNTTVATKTATPTPTPNVLPSQLDGTLVTPDLANRHPLAIMVENHPEARPQSGLTSASIVYEALAEGGISRFLAIYGPNLPSQVGPVRSARTYYVDWAEEYDAFYAHFGGANDALHKIADEHVKDLNGMLIGAPTFWRKYYPGVTGSEHTAFTDPNVLYKLAAQKGWPQTSTFNLWTFKDDAAASQRPTGGTLAIDFGSGSLFAVKYTYDAASNTFLRNMAGAPHKDRITGVQIAPKNILVQTVQEIDKAGKKDHDLQTVGTGPAKLFRDGQMFTGTWKKTATTSRTMFYDSSGKVFTFDRGQTWIEEVYATHSVVWTPGTPPVAAASPTTATH